MFRRGLGVFCAITLMVYLCFVNASQQVAFAICTSIFMPASIVDSVEPYQRSLRKADILEDSWTHHS